jgi:tRNA (adenine22-N1)-methyltransferase
MINISKRLKAIASYVGDNAKIIDIGCDHALLGIYLYKTKKSISVILTDIKEGAVNQAKSNIKKYNLEEKIDLRHGDGLDVLNKGEADTVIISGLGGSKIIDILSKDKAKLIDIENIIIQSNTIIFKVRDKICKLGYYIKDEQLIDENNIIYNIILFAKGKKKYSKKELYFGPVLMKQRGELYKNIIINELKKSEYLFKLIPKRYFVKRHAIKRLIRLLTTELQNM